jgi:stearoyl-CoA desaturase (delta-9 desaturase)
VLKKLAFVIFWIVQASAVLIFFVPFAWSMVALWAVSHFLRGIGLTLSFHRYFAHRSFQMNRAARFVWAFIGTAAMQKGPLWWAGHHVNHHRYADRDGDPHSPMISGVYYAHIGWFPERQAPIASRRAIPVMRDFSKAPEIVWLNSILRAAASCWRSRCAIGGMQWLVWFCAPTMTLAHATFAINTVNHMFWIAPLRHHRRIARNNVTHGGVRGRRGRGTATTTATSAPRATGFYWWEFDPT